MTMLIKTIRADFKQINQSNEFYGLSLKLSQEKGAISELLAQVSAHLGKVPSPHTLKILFFTFLQRVSSTPVYEEL